MPKLILGPGGKFRAEVPALDASGDPTTDPGTYTVEWSLSPSLPGTITSDPTDPFAADGVLGETAGDGQVTVKLIDPSTGVVIATKSADIGETAGPATGFGEIGLTPVQ